MNSSSTNGINSIRYFIKNVASYINYVQQILKKIICSLLEAKKYTIM